MKLIISVVVGNNGLRVERDRQGTFIKTSDSHEIKTHAHTHTSLVRPKHIFLLQDNTL